MKKLIFYLRNRIKMDNGNEIINHWENKIRNSKMTLRGEGNRIIIGKNVNLQKISFEVRGKNNTIEIGDNTIIGENTYFILRGDNHKIIIGKNCMFSRNIKLMASDGHKIYYNDKLIETNGDIEIGDNIWITDNVTILKNIKIGSGNIIGINSTVTKSFEEENVLIAGNPAKIVKKNISWEE